MGQKKMSELHFKNISDVKSVIFLFVKHKILTTA